MSDGKQRSKRRVKKDGRSATRVVLKDEAAKRAALLKTSTQDHEDYEDAQEHLDMLRMGDTHSSDVDPGDER